MVIHKTDKYGYVQYATHAVALHYIWGNITYVYADMYSNWKLKWKKWT